MKLDKLGRLCLQYLEQDPDTNLLDDDNSMENLTTNDTFSEYVNNIYHSIYSAISRLVTSKILPLKEVYFEKGKSVLEIVKELPNGAKIRDFHEIKEVLALVEDNIVEENVAYTIIGSKIRVRNYNSKFDYLCIYYPTIHDLSSYVKGDMLLWDIDLEELGIPDEIAIIIKYYVYSDLKYEENPSTANAAKNYFETYIEEIKTKQVLSVQTECKSNNSWEDVYASASYGTGDDL